MISGILKMWKEAEGWGFIEGDDGDDYFVNIANAVSYTHLTLPTKA